MFSFSRRATLASETCQITSFSMQAGGCALGCNASFSSAAILPDGTYKWPTSKKMLLNYSGFSFFCRMAEDFSEFFRIW